MEDQTMDPENTAGEFTPVQIEQISTIAAAAATEALKQLVKPAEAEGNVQHIDKDPAMNQADEAEASLLKQLANPRFMMVRGRKGAQLINVTKQGLDAIGNWKKERSQYKDTIFVK